MEKNIKIKRYGANKTLELRDHNGLKYLAPILHKHRVKPCGGDYHVGNVSEILG